MICDSRICQGQLSTSSHAFYKPTTVCLPALGKRRMSLQHMASTPSGGHWAKSLALARGSLLKAKRFWMLSLSRHASRHARVHLVGAPEPLVECTAVAAWICRANDNAVDDNRDGRYRVLF